VIRTAWGQGKLSRVYVSETRPLLQGARLTAWELARDGIPATLIADGAAGFLMRRRDAIACVIVGADRIAANGDVANKIGTYTLAVLAREHGIPFYVAAPTSTIDLATASGDQIPIEERPAEEVTSFAGVTVTPAGIEALNPAFDVTPHRYVSAIITERGIALEPYAQSLRQLFQQEGVRHA
jgi:methylthioribose-1-phosphate isomerase